jgi:hypothetical protein
MQSLVRDPEANAVWLGTTTDAKSRLSEMNDAKSVHKKRHVEEDRRR